MNIEKSLWERIESYPSASADGRERFAAKLEGWRNVNRENRRVPQLRTSHFDLTADLRQQDIPRHDRTSRFAA
jgi:hypothetical protein